MASWEEIVSKRRNSPDSGRRNFIKGAALAGAATLTAPAAANIPLSGAPAERAKATQAAVASALNAASERLEKMTLTLNRTLGGGVAIG